MITEKYSLTKYSTAYDRERTSVPLLKSIKFSGNRQQIKTICLMLLVFGGEGREIFV
jgi:hypothetical protein